MQLTKLCASLMRLLSGDREAILTAFENVKEKKLDAVQIFGDLTVIHQTPSQEECRAIE